MGGPAPNPGGGGGGGPPNPPCPGGGAGQPGCGPCGGAAAAPPPVSSASISVETGVLSIGGAAGTAVVMPGGGPGGAALADVAIGCPIIPAKGAGHVVSTQSNKRHVRVWRGPTWHHHSGRRRRHAHPCIVAAGRATP